MIWQFNYHRGSAPLVGMIETTTPGSPTEVSEEDHRLALAVAVAWCNTNGARPPAGIRPMILADESILCKVKPVEEPIPVLPDGIAATTGLESGRPSMGQRIVTALKQPL